jgi:hypothetical protein
MNGAQAGVGNLVAFLGFNGSFTATAIQQVVGSAGGSTLTTIGVLEFETTVAETTNVLDVLMIQMRNALEKKPVG